MPADQDAGEAYERALRNELDRRVAEVSSYPDDAFGRMGRADVLVIALLCVLAPALLLWGFR